MISEIEKAKENTWGLMSISQQVALRGYHRFLKQDEINLKDFMLLNQRIDSMGLCITMLPDRVAREMENEK